MMNARRRCIILATALALLLLSLAVACAPSEAAHDTDAAFQEGYLAGYRDAFEEGYDAGYESGYQAGLQEGTIEPPAESPTEPISDDLWAASADDPMYVLLSRGVDTQIHKEMVHLKPQIGLLGGSMDYIYQGMHMYWSGIRGANTFIFFNAASEDLGILDSWPEQYREILPFSVDELANTALPFALFRRQDDTMMRAIIIASSSSVMLEFANVIRTRDVPVGIPWTLSNGQIVASQTGERWYHAPQELSDANFTVRYPENYGADASDMLTWANEVVSTLQESFSDFLDVIGSRITIEISDTGDPGHASADIGRTAIMFVAPSVSAQSSSYFDTDWYLGNIAHELGHIYLDRCRIQAGGYQRSHVPRWFDEGFCEYLRLLVIGQQRFDEKYSWYFPEVDNIIANGLSGISNVYAGGAWVLRFMESEFSIAGIKAIITSGQATFWGAVTEQTGLSASQFEEQLIEWLKEL